MNIRKPVASYYIGDVTTKNEPQKYIQIFQELFKLYTTLRDSYSSTGTIPTTLTDTNNTDSKKASNPFSVLSNEKDYMLPLIVNTDGNIR